LYGAFGVNQRSIISTSFFLSSPSLCSIIPSSRPALRLRRRAQELSRLAVAPTLRYCSAFARPHLDSFKHDGTLDAIGMTIRGEPAFGRGSIAPQPCIRWEQEPDHDAAMRIGSEAPRWRTHSSSRHDSHESPRDPATSNRHRRPRHKWTD
jgi:hypothetical protein